MSLFSERVSVLLVQQQLSQKELAKKANVTESAMSYYVKGERTPRSDVLIRIAKALNTSTDYLVGNVDNANADYSESDELLYLQRNLKKLDSDRLRKAEKILKSVFDDIFDDDEE